MIAYRNIKDKHNLTESPFMDIDECGYPDLAWLYIRICHGTSTRKARDTAGHGR